MPNKLTPAIEQTGYGISGDLGGLPRQTYYTPDGRMIRAIPAMREYSIKDKDGNVIESGTRDANLDQGWLLSKPKELKLRCRHCGKWHDTEEEIDECKKKQELFIARSLRATKKTVSSENDDLRKEVAELKAMVAKLVGKNGGKGG